MKRAKFRISTLLSLLLAVVMMLTFVGCGKGESPDGDAADAGTAVTTTVTAATTTTGATEAPTTGATEAPTTTATVAPTTTTTATAKKPTTTTTVKTTPTSVPADFFDNAPDELDGQKLRMLVWWDATEDRKRATAFASKTGIQVQFETAVAEDYQSTLYGKVLSGTPPHTAAIRNDWYPLPITRGLMQPIKNTGWDYTNKKDGIYNLSMMEQFSYKGEAYGVALKGSRMSEYSVMFFNKKALTGFGVEEDPYDLWKTGRWNWDTCLEIAQTCTNARKEQYGLTLISQCDWMLSAGQDYVLSDENGLVNNIKSEDLLNTWFHQWDMIYMHKVIPTNFSQQKELFYYGQAAMLGAGSSFMQVADKKTGYVPDNATFDWGVVPFPSPAGQTAIAASEGVVWGFPVDVTGDKLQAAMWWLRYYLDDSTYGNRAVLANEQCWEVLQWMSEQQTQSFNSIATACYSGYITPKTLRGFGYTGVMVDEYGHAAVKVNLEKWYEEIEKNIAAIESGL